MNFGRFCSRAYPHFKFKVGDEVIQSREPLAQAFEGSRVFRFLKLTSPLHPLGSIRARKLSRLSAGFRLTAQFIDCLIAQLIQLAHARGTMMHHPAALQFQRQREEAGAPLFQHPGFAAYFPGEGRVLVALPVGPSVPTPFTVVVNWPSGLKKSGQ